LYSDGRQDIGVHDRFGTALRLSVPIHIAHVGSSCAYNYAYERKWRAGAGVFRNDESGAGRG